jgi:hypothetical protein
MSGVGDWVVYLDASGNGSKCYSFSRITHETHFLRRCGQGTFSISDDGTVASLQSSELYNARTGRKLNTSSVFVGSLTADGTKTALICKTSLFVVDLTTGIYSRVASGLPEIQRLSVTAAGSAVVYQTARGLYEVTTTRATPQPSVPPECPAPAQSAPA